MARKRTQKKAGTPETMSVKVVKDPFAKEQEALTPEAEKLKALVITNDEEAKEAHEKMSWIAKTIKALDAKRLEYTRKIDALKKMVMDDFKKTTAPLEAALEVLREKLNAYDQAQREKREEAQRSYEREVEQAPARGESPLDVPVPVPRTAAIPSMRIPEWEVVDEAQIPYSFQYMSNGRVEEVPLWVLNTVEINKLRRAYGVDCEESPIPGIKFTVRHQAVAR